MAGSYRPRPVEIKACIYCGQSYESRHKRTIYCSASCRTLAYNLRHELDLKEPVPVVPAKTDLAFSGQNVGIVALGSGLTALANAAFNDLPAQDKIMKKIEGLSAQLSATYQELNTHLLKHDDFIEAMKQSDSMLSYAMSGASQKRQLTSPKKVESAQEKGQRMLAERKAKRGY